MDLAKIRKKSLHAPQEKVDERHISVSSFTEPEKNVPEPLPAAASPHGADVIYSHEPHSVPAPSATAAPSSSSAVLHEDSFSRARTPLEAILAGRSAAGCDDESFSVDDDAISQVAVESYLELLCFRVSDEVYGINIMDIKEIIKPREVTEVPRSPSFVSGILSLRGIIVPIIDMRVRLGLDQKKPVGKERVVVIRNNSSFSGLLVDEVIQVVRIQPGALEAAPTVLDGIDRDFISGIGRSEGQMIIILNLANVADIALM